MKSKTKDMKKYMKEYMKKYRDDNQEVEGARAKRWARKKALKAMGLSFEDLERMRDLCGDRCQICGLQPHLEAPPEGGKPPHDLGVDHDHKTGAIRGLLCKRCNAALGLFNDDHILLMSAINYLCRSDSWYRKPM